MTTYFEANHDADLSEYDSTTGFVNWFPVIGYAGGGGMQCNAAGGAAYATKDIGAIGETLYVRAYASVPLGSAVGVLRGRNAAGETCWEVRTEWPEPKSMRFLLWAFDDAGDEHKFTLQPKVNNLGLAWVEVMLKTGADAGQVAAWLQGDQVLAPTAIPPNAARVTKFLDVGAFAYSGMYPLVAMDAIKAADAYVGPVPWTPQLVRTWTQHGKTYEAWSAAGYPTGGWQAFVGGEGGFELKIARAMRGAVGTFELGTQAGRTVYETPLAYGRVDLDSPPSANLCRFSNIAYECRIESCIVRRP